jgi:membrane peptidoglycan carboxypeptidase
VLRYGFGGAISPDFPAENGGIVWSADKWTDSALASVSMGYQIGVTPLQMVTAVSSVANGGELVEPRVIRAVYRDGRRYAVQPKVLRRTISGETAATLTGIMEEVVERGTAKAAQIPGYTIAGKTGTAAKLIGGRYSHADYNASFVGFAPSRDPAVTIIVVIDSPRAKGYYGGSVAAPIFRRIAEATLRYLSVGPTLNPPPPVLVARRDDESRPVTTFDPSRLRQPEVVNAVAEGPSGTVPNLIGMTAREAIHTLVRVGLNARVVGDGVVVAQDPPPGTVLEPNGLCRLQLTRSIAYAQGERQP